MVLIDFASKVDENSYTVKCWSRNVLEAKIAWLAFQEKHRLSQESVFSNNIRYCVYEKNKSCLIEKPLYQKVYVHLSIRKMMKKSCCWWQIQIKVMTEESSGSSSSLLGHNRNNDTHDDDSSSQFQVICR